MRLNTNQSTFWYSVASIVLICIFACILIAYQDNFISIDGDLTYHLSTAQSFVRDGGMSLTETWDSLPEGRPHLYPPVIHFLLAILVFLKTSPIVAIRIFNFVSIIGGICLGWEGIRRLFSTKAAFGYLVLALSFFSYTRLIGITIPASLVLLASPLLIVCIKDKKYVAAGVLFTLMLYTHMVFPWFVGAALLVWGWYHRHYWKPVCRIILWSTVCYMPWLLHIVSNLEYLRYFHSSYTAIVSLTTLYSANVSMVVLFLLALVLLMRLVHSKQVNTDIVYFLALAVVSLPIAYFEFSRYSYSIGIWPMMIVIAYVWSVVGIHKTGSTSHRWIEYAFAVLFVCTACVSLNMSYRSGVSHVFFRNSIILESVIPQEYPYLNHFSPLHFNWYNFVIAQTIEERTQPDAVMYSLAHRLDSEDYEEHRMYILPQLFTALTGLRMANLRSPEYHWREWFDPMKADVLMLNTDQVDEAGNYTPAANVLPFGLKPFHVRSYFDLVARTRQGFDVYVRQQPVHTRFEQAPIVIPLWLGWLIIGAAGIYILASVGGNNKLQYTHMKSSRGFTLIELLVVISIISMLSSLVLASVASARVRGRDGVRMQQVHQMDIAVQLYIADNGTAPLVSSCPTSLTLDENSVFTCVAKSNPPSSEPQAQRDAEAAAWTTLKSAVSKYMPGLKAEACGNTCTNASGYAYVAPAAVKYACTVAGVACTLSDTSYQVYAKLERDSSSVGVSNVLGLSTFYDPASVPPDQGGGGASGGGQ